jgi:hypothetical protein
MLQERVREIRVPNNSTVQSGAPAQKPKSFGPTPAKVRQVAGETLISDTTLGMGMVCLGVACLAALR